MADFISYLTAHWYLIPVFVILIGLTVFMWIKHHLSGHGGRAEMR